MNFPQLLYVVVCCAYQAIATLMHKISLKTTTRIKITFPTYLYRRINNHSCQNQS